MYRVVNQKKKRKKWWVREYVSRKWKNWYRNKVDEEKRGRTTNSALLKGVSVKKQGELSERRPSSVLIGPERERFVGAGGSESFEFHWNRLAVTDVDGRRVEDNPVSKPDRRTMWSRAGSPPRPQRALIGIRSRPSVRRSSVGRVDGGH